MIYFYLGRIFETEIVLATIVYKCVDEAQFVLQFLITLAIAERSPN